MLYQERGEDSLSNLYTIKVVNKTLHDVPLTLRLVDAPGRVIEAADSSILVKKEGQGSGSFFVVLPKTFISKRKLQLKVGLYEGDKQITVLETSFMGAFSKF